MLITKLSLLGVIFSTVTGTFTFLPLTVAVSTNSASYSVCSIDITWSGFTHTKLLSPNDTVDNVCPIVPVKPLGIV